MILAIIFLLWGRDMLDLIPTDTSVRIHVFEEASEREENNLEQRPPEQFSVW